MNTNSRLECNMYLLEIRSWDLAVQGDRKEYPITLSWFEPMTPSAPRGAQEGGMIYVYFIHTSSHSQSFKLAFTFPKPLSSVTYCQPSTHPIALSQFSSSLTVL